MDTIVYVDEQRMPLDKTSWMRMLIWTFAVRIWQKESYPHVVHYILKVVQYYIALFKGKVNYEIYIFWQLSLYGDHWLTKTIKPVPGTVHT